MKRPLWRAISTSAAVILGCGALAVAPAQAAEPVTINLVVTNDFHGQIDENTVQWAGTVQQLLDDAPAANTLFLSAGDNVGESAPASAAQHDDPTLDVLNLLGLDASAAGNHEFDHGYDDLTDHITQRADFPILAANVTKADGTPALPASAAFTAGGVRIAVIGAVTDTTPELLDPSGVAGLTFGDPVEGINAEVGRLQALPEAERPQLILVTIHDGAPWGTWDLTQAEKASTLFSRLVKETSPAVAALITGHTHNTNIFDAPVPGVPGRTRPIIQTGFHGHNVGQIQLTVNPQTGAVTAYTARLAPRITTTDAELVAADPTLAQIATLRDDAVAYATARAGAALEAQGAYDEALTEAEDAYVAAEAAQDAYEAGVSAVNDAYAVALDLKAKYEAAITAGRAAYATAAEIKTKYDAAIATSKSAWATATDLKTRYDAAIAQAKASNATATELKTKYDAAIATSKTAWATATDLKTRYDAATAEAKTFNATATQLREQYQAALAGGASPSSPEMVALADQYNAAVAASKDASARAAALVPPYQDALAASSAASAAAAALVPDYQAAVAATKAANTAAAALVPEYQAAVTASKDASAAAAALVPSYKDAIAAGQASYATAGAIKPDYDAAVTAWKAALATATDLKAAFEAAIEAWHLAESVLDDARTTLLALL